MLCHWTGICHLLTSQLTCCKALAQARQPGFGFNRSDVAKSTCATRPQSRASLAAFTRFVNGRLIVAGARYLSFIATRSSRLRLGTSCPRSTSSAPSSPEGPDVLWARRGGPVPARDSSVARILKARILPTCSLRRRPSMSWRSILDREGARAHRSSFPARTG